MEEYKFVGEDRSLGLRKGKKYLVILKLQYNSKPFWLRCTRGCFLDYSLKRVLAPTDQCRRSSVIGIKYKYGNANKRKRKRRGVPEEDEDRDGFQQSDIREYRDSQ